MDLLPVLPNLLIKAFQLPGLPERVICRVCQSVSSARPAGLFQLIDIHVQTNLI